MPRSILSTVAKKVVVTTIPPDPNDPVNPPAPPVLKPDLILTQLFYTAGVFSCTVKNQGTADTTVGLSIGVEYQVDGVKRSFGYSNSVLGVGASVNIGNQGGNYVIPTGTHTVTAICDDLNRFNESNETNNTMSISVIVGGAAPTVAITAPVNGATVIGTSSTFSANASDDVAVVGVQFKRDGVNIGPEETVAPYSVQWDTTAVTDGSHTLSATARDANGNTTTASVTVNVDNVIEPPASAYKTFTPGLYIADIGGNSDSWFNEQLTRLNTANDPDGDWKGVLIRTNWTDYETSEGVYNFTMLRNRLQAIANYPGRRIIVFFGIKGFGATSHVVPAYVRTAAYADGYGHNGEYAYESGNGGPGGFVVCMHVPAVRTRFLAMIDAMKTFFSLPANANLKQYIEAFVFNELSITFNDAVVNTGPFETAWFNGHRDLMFEMSTNVWPEKWVVQWINAPRSRMATFVPQIVNGGIGVGCPDCVDNDIGLNFDPAITPSTAPGNLWHLKQSAGKVLIMTHMSSETLNSSIAARAQGCKCVTTGCPTNCVTTCTHVDVDKPYYPGPAKTRQFYQTFAKSLGATHVLWGDQGGSHDTFLNPKPKASNANNKCDLPAIYAQVYPGQNRRAVTDAFVHNAASDISVITTQPTKGLLP